MSPSYFLVDPYDKEELCDNYALISSPQLEIAHSPVSLVVLNLLQEDGNNSIGCIEQFEQLQPLLKCKKNDCAAPTTSEEGKQSNTLDAEHNACEYVSNTLQLPAVDASLLHFLVQLPAECGLSQIEHLSHDHKKLLENISCIPQMHIRHEHLKSVWNDVHVFSTHVHCISSKKEELKLLSSFNTLGYIEFEVPCNLNCLKENLHFGFELLSLHHCSLHAIGEYDWKGEYLVHKIYICSRMKHSMGLQGHDETMGCTNANDDLYNFSSFDLMQKIKPQK